MIKILTISGGFGAGKSVISRKLLEDENFGLVISTTTRPRRATDNPGEYEYLSAPEEFRALDEKGEFLWTTPLLRGHRYGTKKTAVDQALNLPSEKISVMILAPEVLPILADHINKRFGNRSCCLYLSLFIQTPLEMVIQRLRKEGLSETDIKKRLDGDENRNWKGEMDKAAEVIGLSYLTVSNDRPLEETIAVIRNMLRFF